MDRDRRRPRRYTVKQAAERMGFSESFVRDLLENNEIGHIRRQTKSGSSIRIRERDIEQWELENSVCPGVDNNNRTLSSSELREVTTGISPGQRPDDLEEFRQERRMKKQLDESSPSSWP